MGKLKLLNFSFCVFYHESQKVLLPKAAQTGFADIQKGVHRIFTFSSQFQHKGFKLFTQITSKI